MVIVFGVFFTPNEYRDVINHINNLSLFHLQLMLSAEAFEERLIRRPRQPIQSISPSRQTNFRSHTHCILRIFRGGGLSL